MEILVILKHYFKLSLKMTEAASKIQEVEGYETTSDHIFQNLFKHFHCVHSSLVIKIKQLSLLTYDALE